MSHFIAKILKKGPVLRLEFVGGAVRDLDLEPESRRGPAFVHLTEPEYVNGVKIAWDGYLLEWPDGMTWGADNIWKRSRPVKAASPSGGPSVAKAKITVAASKTTQTSDKVRTH